MEERGNELLYNGSKLEGKVSKGVFCRELSINFIFRFPEYCKVFQSEVADVKVAVDLLLSCAAIREVTIHSDSKVAILALS